MKKLINNKIIQSIFLVLKALVGTLVALVLVIIITQRIFNNEQSFFGYRIFTVASGSMEPKYTIMDMLLVTDLNSADIKVGDDLVYMGQEGTYAGKVITHQVIEINDDAGKKQFLTQGIANPLSDPLVNEEQVYGKVIHKLSVFSCINKIISTSIGFLLLIILPISILILLEIIDIKEKRESIKNAKEE